MSKIWPNILIFTLAMAASGCLKPYRVNNLSSRTIPAISGFAMTRVDYWGGLVFTPGETVIYLMAKDWTNRWPDGSPRVREIARTVLPDRELRQGPGYWVAYSFPSRTIPSWAWNPVRDPATGKHKAELFTSWTNEPDIDVHYARFQIGQVFENESQETCYRAMVLHGGNPYLDDSCHQDRNAVLEFNAL